MLSCSDGEMDPILRIMNVLADSNINGRICELRRCGGHEDRIAELEQLKLASFEEKQKTLSLDFVPAGGPGWGFDSPPGVRLR